MKSLILFYYTYAFLLLHVLIKRKNSSSLLHIFFLNINNRKDSVIPEIQICRPTDEFFSSFIALVNILSPLILYCFTAVFFIITWIFLPYNIKEGKSNPQEIQAFLRKDFPSYSLFVLIVSLLFGGYNEIEGALMSSLLTYYISVYPPAKRLSSPDILR